MREQLQREVDRIRAASSKPEWVFDYLSSDGHEVIVIDGSDIYVVALYENAAGCKIVIQRGNLGDFTEVSNDFKAAQ